MTRYRTSTSRTWPVRAWPRPGTRPRRSAPPAASWAELSVEHHPPLAHQGADCAGSDDTAIVFATCPVGRVGPWNRSGPLGYAGPGRGCHVEAPAAVHRSSSPIARARRRSRRRRQDMQKLIGISSSTPPCLPGGTRRGVMSSARYRPVLTAPPGSLKGCRRPALSGFAACCDKASATSLQRNLPCTRYFRAISWHFTLRYRSCNSKTR